MKVQNYKNDFPFFANEDIIYLDSAATSQKPQVVLDAVNNYYTHYCSNTHRGSHDLGNKATTEYEQARTRIAHFLNAQPKEIVFTRGTTEAINLVASCFVKDNFSTVILSPLEHHSNILPWLLAGLHIEVVAVDKDLNIDIQAFDKLLQEHPKSFVSLTHVSNVVGIINPIKELTALAHKHGCSVLIDGAQALAHETIDLKDLNVDFYAVSAHKAYGPTGIGALYGKYELLDAMPPYQGGGSMIKEVDFDSVTFLEPPLKFEAGTQAIAQAIGFAKAIDYVQSLNDRQAYDRELMNYAKHSLQTIEGVKLYTQATNVCGNISFSIEGVHHDDIAILLSKQKIMLRTGHHCAQPLMKLLGVVGTIRLSFAIYSTKEDIDLTIKALKKVLKMLL